MLTVILSKMTDQQHAIRVNGLSKRYLIYSRPEDRLKQSIVPRLQKFVGIQPKQYFQDFAALHDISFEVGRGETVGIIGRNGCGKSTLLQIICGVLASSSGEVSVNGRIAALLELGAGFNPEFTGRENAFMYGSILGLSHKEMLARFDDIAAFADIGQFLEQPVKTYSSGMYVRLAFAVAINVQPDILVVDEALAVGDVAFQRKCFARLEQIKARGATILFVSHSTSSVVELCDRAILLDGGELLLDGKPKRVTSQYLKLVHMPADKLPEAREMVRALQGLSDEGEEVTDVSTPEIVKDEGPVVNTDKESEAERERRLQEEEGWYDPNLKSQSVVEYESRGARIRDLRIIASSGRQVNILKTGQRYVYEYYVDFEKDAEDLGFGMLIKTVSGFELGGSSTGIIDETRVKQTNSGSTFHVTHEFKCCLMPGAYFLNAGTMGINSKERESVFLHRFIDGLVFRVADETPRNANGIVNFGIRSNSRHIDKPLSDPNGLVSK